MNRNLLRACLALVVTAASVAGASADEVYSIRGPGTLKGAYCLGVVKGQARLVKLGGDGYCHWTFERTAKGVLIRTDTRKGGKRHSRYLNYDPTGKDKAVFVSEEPTAGSYWAVVKNTAEGEQPYVHSFHPKAGKLSLWTLSVGGKAERLKDDLREPFTAYKVVLERDPKPVPRFYLIEIAP
jgi:hypothetical protein